MIKIHPSLVLLIALVLAGPVLAQEILAQEKAVDGLGGELDFSLAFQTLTDRDMDETYSYLPQLGVGYSFLVAPELRTYLGLRYGWKSGDPYHGLPGFDGGQEISVKTVPFLIGLKVNLAQSSRVRLQLGLAFMLAYVREQTPPQIDYNGQLDDSAASNVLGGYLVSFAPEWWIGGGRNALGLEIAYGGTQGTLNSDTHSHSIDLTGFSGRVYYILGLGGK